MSLNRKVSLFARLVVSQGGSLLVEGVGVVLQRGIHHCRGP
jgi:hypothetical protein